MTLFAAQSNSNADSKKYEPSTTMKNTLSEATSSFKQASFPIQKILQ